MLQFIADHQQAIRIACGCFGVLLAFALAGLALDEAQRPESQRETVRHRRAQGVAHARPGEMRRHRRATETYLGTGGGTYAPAAPHTLRGRDRAGRRYRVANLVEHTGEISVADLEALMARSR